MDLLTFVSILFLTFKAVSSHTCVCAEFTAAKCNAEANCCWNEMVPQTGITYGVRGKCRSVKYLECKADPSCTIKYNDPTIVGTPAENSEIIADKLADLVSAYNKLRSLDDIQDNGNDPTESRELDWPWVCTEEDTELQYEGDKEEVCAQFTRDHFEADNSMDTAEEADKAEETFYAADDDNTVYAADPVDVSQIEVVAQKLYYAKQDKLMKKTENISSKPGSSYQSMTGLQIGAGIVFIVLLFSAMFYWQCNKDKMDNKENQFISLSQSNSKGTKYSTFDNI